MGGVEKDLNGCDTEVIQYRVSKVDKNAHLRSLWRESAHGAIYYICIIVKFVYNRLLFC